MGQGTSQLDKHQEALRLLTPSENLKLEEISASMAQKNGGKAITNSAFQKYVGRVLEEPFASRLFKAIAMLDGEQATSEITKDKLAIGVVHMVKGTSEYRSYFMLRLATDNKSATTDDLIHLIQCLILALEKIFKQKHQHEYWSSLSHAMSDQRLAHFLMQDILTDKENDIPVTNGDSNLTFTEQHLETLLSRSALCIRILDEVFRNCFPIVDVDDSDFFSSIAPLVPHFELGKVLWSRIQSLLDTTSIIFLNNYIPVELRTKWRFVFATAVHGAGFSGLVREITKKGPTVLVLRDKHGHVFGGFASHSWQLHHAFYGDDQSFLFQLKPNISIYHPSGYNTNFMYLNHGQQTMPNGLGMGGQFEFFGLWIDSYFGKGHSKAKPKCVTFNSPQLSFEEDFEIEFLEVWALGGEPAKVSPTKNDSDSILDKDPGAKAMLSLIGRGPVSEGLREKDATASSPEEHTLPLM